MNTTPATAPSETLAGFAALLRDHGLSVGIAEQQAMVQAALTLGAVSEQRLQAAWRAIACHDAREWRLWPDLFDRYWHAHRMKGGVRVSGQTRPSRDLRQLVQQMHEQLDAARSRRRPDKPAPQTAGDRAGRRAEDWTTAPRRAPRAAPAAPSRCRQRDGQSGCRRTWARCSGWPRQITRPAAPPPHPPLAQRPARPPAGRAPDLAPQRGQGRRAAGARLAGASARAAAPVHPGRRQPLDGNARAAVPAHRAGLRGRSAGAGVRVPHPAGRGHAAAAARLVGGAGKGQRRDRRLRRAAPASPPA